MAKAECGVLRRLEEALVPVSGHGRRACLARGADLEPFDISKGTVRFSLDEPVPAKLVERIVTELRKGADARRRTSDD